MIWQGRKPGGAESDGSSEHPAFFVIIAGLCRTGWRDGRHVAGAGLQPGAHV